MKSIYLCITIFLVLCFSCSVDDPTSFAPGITVNEASNVSYVSADLSATLSGNNVKKASFILSTNQNFTSDTQEISAIITNGYIKVSLDGLMPSTTYFYKLNVSSGYSKVISDIKSFTTQDLTVPYINSLSIDIEGDDPVLSFNVTPVYSLKQVIVKYKSKYDIGIQTKTISLNEYGSYKDTLTELHPATSYEISVYAENQIGKMESHSKSFVTNNCVHIKTAGTLQNLITSEQKYSLNKLKIIGPLNGTDVILIREMAGVGNSRNNHVSTSGKLEILDLTYSTFEKGGNEVLSPNFDDYWLSSSFYNHSPNILFQGMETLKKVILPNYIEQVETFDISLSSLEDIESSSSNLKSEQGVLFNGDMSKLISFPPKKKIDQYFVPKSVYMLGMYSFSKVVNLKLLTLSSTLKYIDFAFNGYQNESVYHSELIIPFSVENIYNGSFLFGGTGLYSIIFLANVRSIPEYCFASPYLESVTLGTSIQIIQKGAFSGCHNLKEIHCLSSTPPSFIDADETTFNGVDKTTCTIYVPKGSASSYRSAAVWKEFSHIVEE